MSVLVTGATTSLGKALVRRILARDDERVLALGAEPPEQVTGLRDRRIIYLCVDLTRPRRVRRLLHGPVRDLGVHTIVHAAQHRSASERGRRAHRLNVESTRLMLRLAEHHPTITRFVLRSYGQVYLVRSEIPALVREDQRLDLRPDAPQWIRDRVEADLIACTQMGRGDLRVTVLRCAEILAPGTGSQLHDYLESAVCFRPMGYDPMLDVLSLEDAARALHRAVHCDCGGVFNIPGFDVLPLSVVIRKWGRRDVPVPGPLLGPLYRARRLVWRSDFEYALNLDRFHLGVLLDGTRAREVLGWRPTVPVAWPDPHAAAPVL